jgi:hypothetical protein
LTTTADYSAIDSSSSNNEWADFWRYHVGVNVIPANSKEKVPIVAWKEFQSNPVPEEIHNQWKEDRLFDQGMAVILGRIWHKSDMRDYSLVGIDCDNQKAIQELLTRNGRTITPEQFANNTIVEQHLDNREKMHIYVYTNGKPLRDKTSDIGRLDSEIDPSSVPIFEVKAPSKYLMYCCPSMHKNGHKYQILGTRTPLKLNDEGAEQWQQEMDAICRKYGLGVGESNKISIKDLFKEDTVIYEGHNRHEAILRAMESLLRRNSGILSIQQIEELCEQWNIDHCNPPLTDLEFRKQMKSAMEFIQNNNSEIQSENASTGDSKLSGNSDGKEDSNESQDRRNELLEIINERTSELFVDKHDTAFAAVAIDDHVESLPIKSGRFKKWICRLNWKHLHKTIRAEDLKQITDLLQAEALFSNNVKDLELRTSKNPEDNSICYDLTNKQWQLVKVTEQGWSVEESADMPIMFTRYANQIAQVTPAEKYSVDILDRFLNLLNIKDDNNKLLLKCYIISLFIPGMPKPILMLHGEQGSAKSTLQELVKRLVDPSSIISLTFPRSNEELIQQMSHNYVAYFDNISFIKEWTSDQLCRAVTGAGFSKRELYSDDDDIIYNFKRCLGFNGINLAATKADLLDRGIIVELERIAKDKRRKIEEILEEFEPMKAQLLGYIFDILVKVLQIKNNGGIKLETKSRMADFEEYAEIISRCMDNEPGRFIQAYHGNQQLQTEVVIEGSPVAMAIVKLMEGREEWNGSSTELLTDLELVTAELKINTQSHSWPKAANVLSRRLNEIKTSLRDADINIDYIQHSGSISKKINIRKVSSQSSYRPEDQNRAQNEPKSADDTTDDTLSLPKISSGETPTIRAQHGVTDDTDDMDDIVRTSKPAEYSGEEAGN